jgi:hypothetical protein
MSQAPRVIVDSVPRFGTNRPPSQANSGNMQRSSLASSMSSSQENRTKHSTVMKDKITKLHEQVMLLQRFKTMVK